MSEKRELRELLAFMRGTAVSKARFKSELSNKTKPIKTISHFNVTT